MMKQVMISFNPFAIAFVGGKHYEGKNITKSSKKRLDKTIVALCESGKMNMCIYTDFRGNRTLSFEPSKTMQQ
jgi:hypothetical protein